MSPGWTCHEEKSMRERERERNSPSEKLVDKRDNDTTRKPGRKRGEEGERKERGNREWSKKHTDREEEE